MCWEAEVAGCNANLWTKAMLGTLSSKQHQWGLCPPSVCLGKQFIASECACYDCTDVKRAPPELLRSRLYLFTHLCFQLQASGPKFEHDS